MSEEILIAIVVLTLSGGMFATISYTDHNRNECVKLLADKPPAEIQLVCGVKR